MKKQRLGNKGFTLGELIVVFAIVLIVGVLMWPFIHKSCERTDNIICTNNLRKLGWALYVYAREHEGKFPAAIKTLYDEHYLADVRVADCPATRGMGTPEEPDYIYTAGLSVRAPSLGTLVRDKSINHPGGGKNVLYVNGVVGRKE